MLAEVLQRSGYPIGGHVSMYRQSKPEVTRSAEASSRVNLYGRQGMQQLTTKRLCSELQSAAAAAVYLG